MQEHERKTPAAIQEWYDKQQKWASIERGFQVIIKVLLKIALVIGALIALVIPNLNFNNDFGILIACPILLMVVLVWTVLNIHDELEQINDRQKRQNQERE